MSYLLVSNAIINTIIFLGLGVAVTIAIIIIAKKIADSQIRYSLKSCLLSNTEKNYYIALKNIIGDKFCVLPQINLASVINKDSQGFRSELFRNVDFGVFNQDFEPILLIEINDPTHLRDDRIERDKSVNKICKKAGIPLITFWVNDGIDENKMARIIYKYL